MSLNMILDESIDFLIVSEDKLKHIVSCSIKCSKPKRRIRDLTFEDVLKSTYIKNIKMYINYSKLHHKKYIHNQVQNKSIMLNNMNEIMTDLCLVNHKITGGIKIIDILDCV